MKKLFALTILSFASSVVYGQYFHYLHTYDATAEYNRNILLRSDNSLIITGGYLEFSNNHENACWYNISQDGNSILSKKHIHTDAHAYYNSYSGNTKKLSNGGYVIPYTLHYYPNDPDRWFNITTLVFLNAQLDTEMVRRYTDTSLYSEGVYDCAVLSDGSCLLGGERISSYVAQQSHTKGLVTRVDDQGNLMWQKDYEKEPGKSCRVHSVQPLDNNRSLIGGSSVDIVSVGSDSYLRRKPWFAVIDNTNGSILKDTLYTSGYAYHGWIYNDASGGYYHTGKKDSLATTDPDDIENFPAYIAHLDTNFNIEWVTSFPYSYQPYAKYVWKQGQLQNGDFLISGAAVGSSGWSHGWVSRISNVGTILWSKYYYSQVNKNGYLADFVERPDGNIIICGWTSNDTVESWRGQELWLLGLYADGEVLTGTGSVANVQVKTMEFDIYPNPASETFYLDVPEPGFAELYDMSGRQVAKYDVPKKGKIELRLSDRIAAGNYLLQFTGGESGMVAGKQLVRTGIH